MISFLKIRMAAVRVQEVALCISRKWWRPWVCIGMAGSLMVNGVVLPLWKGTPADMSGLAALVLALAPFAYFRTLEKKAGVATSE